MELPKIDATTLPELPSAAGLFSPQPTEASGVYSDDTIIILMTYLYELMIG